MCLDPRTGSREMRPRRSQTTEVRERRPELSDFIPPAEGEISEKGTAHEVMGL